MKKFNKSKVYFITSIIVNLSFWLSTLFVIGGIFSFSLLVSIKNPILKILIVDFLSPFFISTRLNAIPILTQLLLIFLTIPLLLWGFWLGFKKKLKSRLILIAVILSLITLFYGNYAIYFKSSFQECYTELGVPCIPPNSL